MADMAARTRTNVSVTPEHDHTTALDVSGSDADILVSARIRFSAESALAASESVETATAYATEALATYAAAEREGKRASVYAAMSAASAVRAGLLTDGPKGKDAAEGVKDAKEWGDAWITPAHPEGVSRQMVDTWIRAGEAFLGWGLDPESAEGKRLLGGLAQSKEWNKARKDFREALEAAREETGEEADPATVAEMVTARVVEVRAEAEAEAKRKKDARDAEKLVEAKRVKEALAKKNAEGVKAPESLADRVTVAEQIIAGLRSSLKKEREILEDLAARIAFKLAEDAEAEAS